MRRRISGNGDAADLEPAQVGTIELGRQLELRPKFAVARAGDGRVHGEAQRANASRFGALHEFAGETAITLDVKLEPQRLRGNLGDSSMLVVATVLTTMVACAAPAPRAVASSPSGCASL